MNKNDNIDPSTESLAQRVLEMEDLARELARATEEADHSLIKLQSLYDVSRELNASLDVGEIMQKTVRHLTMMTYANSSAIWLLEGGVLFVEAAHGLKTAVYQDLFIPMSQVDSRIVSVFQTQRVQRIHCQTATGCNLDLLRMLGTQMILALPLTVQNAILGVVTLHGQDARLEDDLELVQTVVQQAAIAIQNGKLYEEVRQLNQNLEQHIATRTRELVREKERLETMYQITACLTNTLDQTEMIQKTLEQLVQAVDAEDGQVWLIQADHPEHLVCAFSLNGRAENGRSSHTSTYAEAMARQVVAQRQGFVVGDLHEMPQWQTDTQSPHAVVTAPLLADRDLHGALLLTDSMPYQFSAAHLRLIETGAAQLASAINNARLHEYVQAQVVRLGDMLHAQEVEASQKQAFLASISDGVIACDINGRILLVNPAASGILGQPEAELLHTSIQTAFQVLDIGCPKVLRAFAELKQTGYTADNMRELTLELGRQVLNARLSLVTTTKQGVIGAVIVLRDITREVEAARAKSEFISTVSHELRTPMTSIKGYTNLMQRGVVGALNGQQAHFMDVIYRNADRLSLLINDLLDVSRIEAGKIKLDLQELHLADLVMQVHEAMLVPAQNKGLALELDICPDLPLVKADHDRIIQVLTNLVGNAIAYTEQGSVTIRLCPVSDAVHVSVTDTGIGISNDEMKRIFERFYRSDHRVVQANSGTGLGLSIVQDFIEMHGGRIWVESKPGVGSSFTFILPAYQNNQ